MVEGLFALDCGLNEHPKVLDHPVLADVFFELARAKGDLRL